jgi:hypothetical protein
MPLLTSGVDAIISLLVLNMSYLLIAIVAFLSEHDLSENRFPPRIKSGAGFFGIMLQCVDRSLSLRLLRAICCVASCRDRVANASCLAETAMPVVANRQIADTHFEAGNGRCEALTAQSTVR